MTWSEWFKRLAAISARQPKPSRRLLPVDVSSVDITWWRFSDKDTERTNYTLVEDFE